MADPLRSLLRRARREAARRSLHRAVAVGCAIASAAALLLVATVGRPGAWLASLAVPAATLVVVVAARRPTDVAIARALDEQFATGDLFATALHVPDDAIGRAIVAQAAAAADRLATADLAVDRVARRRQLAAGGVALAASLTLAAVLAPMRRAAEVGSSTVARAGEASIDRDASTADRSDGPASRATHAGEPDSADASQMTSDDPAAARDAGRGAAGGTGQARTAVAVAPPPPPRLPSRRGDAAPSGDAPTAGDASTAGDGDARGAATALVAGTGVAARSAIDAAAMDATDVGGAAIARGAIDAGRVPAGSRALVRAFFDSGDPAR